MREHVIKEITGLWYAILVQFHAIERRDVVKNCLATMRPYISWIDIGLVVNDKFIPLFVQYLSVESYREHVLDCYHEIIAKGMDANVKLTLIEQLRITELIESLFGIVSVTCQ
jgi:exportin-T